VNKSEYFLEALKLGACLNKGWVFSCFAKASLKEVTGKHYPGKLYEDEKGFYTKLGDEESETIRIDQSAKPLFVSEDRITVNPGVIANITTKVKASPSELLCNHLLLVVNFGDRIGYLGKDLSLRNIDKIAWDLLVDDGAKDAPPGSISVKEWLQYTDKAVPYLNEFSFIFSIAATETNVVPPPKIEAYKKKLLIKYGTSLQDPLTQTNFEGELESFAKEYLKDDPTYGILLKGKMWTSYKKLHLTYGSATTFDGLTEHVPEALSDGLKTDAASHADRMNNLRYGSFARAKNTAMGGVVPKYFLGAAGHYTLVEKDCGSKGFSEIRITSDPLRWLGSYAAGSTKLIPESSLSTGKVIKVRDPSFCKSGKSTLCKYCVGDRIFNSDKSIGLLLSNLGAVVLKHSLKSFHVTTLSSKKVVLSDYLN